MTSKMLYFRPFRGEITNEGASLFSEFKTRLTAKLEPLLEPAVRAVARVLAASPEELKRTGPSQPALYESGRLALDGELLTDGESLFVVATMGDTRRRLLRRLETSRLDTREASSDAGLTLDIFLIGPQWNSESLRFILEQAKLSFGVDLKQFSYHSDRFNELKAEAREGAAEPSFTDDEVKAAEILADRVSRSIAIAIKSSGGLLIRDVSKQVPNESREKVEAAIATLRDGRVIDSEVVVVCRKTQSQVSRAPNREVLVELSAKGVKCACGRALAEEQMEEALAATELGKSSLDKARWLTILLIKELERVGISNDAILIEQSIGGDEIDCVANISGELTLFELKDKEFNLGNAYSFGAKIGIIRPEYPVILTTERVGNDAKEHFVRARTGRRDAAGLRAQEQTELTYIEGLPQLRGAIEDLVSRIYRKDATSMIDRVLPLGTIDSQRLLTAFERKCASHRDLQQQPSVRATA